MALVGTYPRTCLACLELIEQYDLYEDEAAGLLQQTGWYLTERARYREAEPYLTCALSMSEEEHRLEHVDTARNALTLGYLYEKQRKYEEAEPLYKRALAIVERVLGETHPTTRTVRVNYAYLLREMDREDEARALEQKEEQS